MREIKFRAWHNDLKKMLYPPYGFDSMTHVRDSNGQHVEITIDGKEVPYPATMIWDGRQYIHGIYQNLVWLQFTGLKDKYGKEIYEGDLLRYPGDDENFTAYEVFFHDGDANSDFNIGYSCNRTHHHGNVCGGPIPSFKPKSVHQMEVIGNIYENPELLKQ